MTGLRGARWGALLVAMVCIPAIAGAKEELQVPSESALWEAAGRSFAKGEDKSAAMQQYRLYVNTYDDTDRAAKAQFMLAECYFAMEDYQQAIQEYRRVDDHKGRDDYLEASVLLRIGECHFNLSDYREAIREFTAVRQRYPASEKVPSALLRAGLARLRPNPITEAREVFRSVMSDYPRSDEAVLAQRQLENLAS